MVSLVVSEGRIPFLVGENICGSGHVGNHTSGPLLRHPSGCTMPATCRGDHLSKGPLGRCHCASQVQALVLLHFYLL